MTKAMEYSPALFHHVSQNKPELTLEDPIWNEILTNDEYPSRRGVPDHELAEAGH